MNIFNKFKGTLKRNKILKVVLGMVTGGGLGFLYYYFIGCSGNSCPITSNPYATIIFGVVLGIIITV